jgi:hypothetical protein
VAVSLIGGWNRRKPSTCHWHTLSHNVIEYTSQWTGFELTKLMVIGTDCRGNCNICVIMILLWIVSTVLYVFGVHFIIRILVGAETSYASYSYYSSFYCSSWAAICYQGNHDRNHNNYVQQYSFNLFPQQLEQ